MLNFLTVLSYKSKNPFEEVYSLLLHWLDQRYVKRNSSYMDFGVIFSEIKLEFEGMIEKWYSLDSFADYISINC